MKVKERARADLAQALKETAGEQDRPWRQNLAIGAFMHKRGWVGMTSDTLLDTARTLGFLVIGTQIVDEDNE